MTDLDETDLEILRLLLDDARRPYSDIADRVGLSPPAVSDRVSRLRERGVIRGFTLDLDRSTLRAGVPVLVRLSVAPDAVDAVYAALRDADGVEHVFATADAAVVAHANAPADVRAWLRDAVDMTLVGDYEVDLVSAVDWAATVDGAALALSCAECGNTVTSEGGTARVGGERRAFCCPSCEARFRDRYRALTDAA